MFTSLETHMITALTVCACVIAFVIMLFWVRARWQKEALYCAKAEFITPHGTGYWVLKPVIRGMIDMPPNPLDKESQGRTYVLNDLCCYLVPHPDGKLVPNFLRTQIKKVVFQERCWEPITKNALEEQLDPLLDPDMLFNIKNEKMTDLAVEHARAEAELEKRLSGLPGLRPLYYIVGALGLIMVGIGVFLFVQLSNVSDVVNSLAGVG
jgi:hypothetical protein